MNKDLLTLVLLTLAFCICALVASVQAQPTTPIEYSKNPTLWRLQKVYKQEPATFGVYNAKNPKLVVFNSFCNSQDCLDRVYDVFVDTRDIPVTDYAITYCLKTEWEQFYGKKLYELSFDPLWADDFPEHHNIAVCELGAGCSFK